MSTRILIVEDEQLVAADLQDKLVRLGHKVVGLASSGLEAVELARQLKPELVFMDVRLQGAMDGIEASGEIQKLLNVPIIFITAFASVFLEDPSLMTPPGLCLSKPFSTNQLRTLLDVIAPTVH